MYGVIGYIACLIHHPATYGRELGGDRLRRRGVFYATIGGCLEGRADE